MKILLEETKKGTWEISVVPTTKEDLQRQPTHSDLGMIMLAVARDLLTLHFDKDKPVEKGDGLIQLPNRVQIDQAEKGKPL